MMQGGPPGEQLGAATQLRSKDERSEAPAHTWFGAQAMPQPPQLARSRNDTHCPPQQKPTPKFELGHHCPLPPVAGQGGTHISAAPPDGPNPSARQVSPVGQFTVSHEEPMQKPASH